MTSRIANDYQILEEIGHGAQGRIFKAVRKSDGQRVVIKQLNVSSVKSWKEYELFKREGEVLKSLDVPGVAHFYDAVECLDEEPAYSYIVQEYIDGASLQTMMTSGHRFRTEEVYDILIQTLKILGALHRHQPPVIHRDIKPSNILLRPVDGDNDMVYLIDFGAVANPQVQSGGSTVAGTYGYMPPEQLTGKPQPESDIYALAAVAVHLMSGRSPADMPVKDFHLIFEPDLQNLPPVVVNTLRQMLEPDISKRLTDIQQIKKLFNDFRDNTYPVVQNAFANDAEYDIALRDVESLGQPGNIELWQRLSDSTPRPLPKAYQRIELSQPDVVESSTNPLCVGNLYEHKWKDVILKPGRFEYGHLKKLLIISVVASLCVGLGIGGSYLFRAYDIGLFQYLGMFGCVVLFGALLLTLFDLFGLIFSIPGAFRRLANVPKEPALTKSVVRNDRLEKLLKEGRKTIATITEVEFVPCPDDATELALFICNNELDESKKNLKENPGCKAIRRDTPMFRIKY
jgi:serine/threonine protein kinase